MMMEQRKADRKKILGIDMDNIRVDRALHLTNRYLEKNKLEYIAFVNTSTALAGHEKEEFIQFMEQAALVLPGDNNIEDALEIRTWIEEETSYQAEYFRRLLGRLNRQRGAVSLMVEKPEELEQLKGMFQRKYEKIHLEYYLWTEEDNIDSMVNDINTQAPELLLMCGDYGRICHFIKEHGCKVNAGVCTTMGAIMSDEEEAVPNWVEHFHLVKLYTIFYKKPLHFWHDTLFKQIMKKKQEEEQLDSVHDDEKC